MSTQTPLIESIKTSTPSASVSLFHGRKIMRYSINRLKGKKSTGAEKSSDLEKSLEVVSSGFSA
ncbi:hypothetical protein YC2023_061736 [Brassica napus]